MNQNRELMRNILRTDLITMKGGKNGAIWLYLGFILFMIVMGFIVSPLAGLYIPFLMGAFYVPMLFNNEMKYHSERLWSLLPIQRKDLVNARFLLSIGLYLAANTVFYLLMLLSMRLQLWTLFGEGDVPDLITIVAERQGFSKISFFHLCFFAAFSFGLCCMASSLRKYFRNPEQFFSLMQLGSFTKAAKGEYIALVLILGVIALAVLVITGILPLGAAVSVLIQLFVQLAGAADGFLLGAVVLTIGAFQTAYEYISTLIEYEKREL